jgi:CRISPR-associated protein Csm4
MCEMKIVKLRFKSAIHLGADIAGIGQENTQLIAHSDTLFSCLINNYAQLHSRDLKRVENLLETFCDGTPAFQITSGFPFVTERYRTEYYLPKPLIDPPDFLDTSFGRKNKDEYGKEIKRTHLVPIEVFTQWLGGNEILPYFPLPEINDRYFIEFRPQHARDRLTNATVIYHTGLVHFHVDAGIYFLIELNDPNIFDWDAFKSVLKLAGQNGLGGRRSLGNGIFKVDEDTIVDLDGDWQDLFNLPQQDGFINLSLYFPRKLDDLAPVAYQLVPRRGWCFSTISTKQLKRKTCSMFTEGSVFRNPIKGTMANVTPDEFSAHQIYRYGIPISLPIQLLESKNVNS